MLKNAVCGMKDQTLKVKIFLEKKKDMVENEEDLRVIEKLLVLNPGFIRCPNCHGELKIHHWEKAGKAGTRTPFFKCHSCDFLG